MGVNGAWPAFRQYKVSQNGPPISKLVATIPAQQTAYIDLSSSFYVDIVKALASHEHTGSTRLLESFARYLLNIAGIHQNLVIVMDGGACAQIQGAINKRHT